MSTPTNPNETTWWRTYGHRYSSGASTREELAVQTELSRELVAALERGDTAAAARIRAAKDKRAQQHEAAKAGYAVPAPASPTPPDRTPWIVGGVALVAVVALVLYLRRS